MTTADLSTLEQVLAECLYYLADKRTPRAPRYVGVTKDPTARLHEHRKRWGSGNAAFGAWKDSVRAGDSDIVLIVLQRFATRAEALEAEWRLTARWVRRGVPLTSCLTQARTGAFYAYCARRTSGNG